MTNIDNFSKVKSILKGLSFSDCLLAAILIALPSKNIYTSIATIFFVGWALFFAKKSFNFHRIYFLPIAYFIWMTLSLLWTKDFAYSLPGLQKQLPFLFIPLVFFFLTQTSKEILYRILRIYSYGMVLFGLFFLIKGVIRYVQTQNTAVFFHSELVSYEPGAIYISVFTSLAVFYFIQIRNKTKLESFCVLILAILIFLLSSKSIITIDFIIVICYYAFFVKIPSGTKALTILSVSVFLIFSVFYVKKVKERFLIEYETAFIDNTLNSELTKDRQNIYNVSINEAWNKQDFHKNSFFPGTALRIYQMRVFLEMLSEQHIFFNGFGLEASQSYIRQKAREHNLDDLYGDYNFHNQYVQTFAELGIIGFLILISMLIVNLKNAFLHKDFLHITFAITMIMLFLSESFFCRQRGIIFFIILYCLFNSASLHSQQRIKTK